MILVTVHQNRLLSSAQAQAVIRLVQEVPSLGRLPVTVIRAVEASPEVSVTGFGIVPFAGRDGHGLVMELADKLTVLGDIFYTATIRLVMADGTPHSTEVPRTPRDST